MDYEAKRQRLMNWKPPGSEPAGLMTMVLRGGPLHAGGSLASLIPKSVGPTPALDESAEGAADTESIAQAASLKPARKKGGPHKPAEADCKRRRRMMNAFVAILILVGSVKASSLARQVAEADDTEAYELISLAFEGKRTATLACRLSSLTAYFASAWSEVWPPTSDSTYGFFRSWASASEAASRAPRFLETLRFLKVLSFELDAVTTNPILLGYSLRQTRRLGLRRQAGALESEVVSKLEEIVAVGALDHTCLLVAGGFLLALLLRARFSDLASWTGGVRRTKDSIYVEVERTKTSGRLTDRLPLFLVGPLELTTSWAWLDAWLALRTDLRLTQRDPVFPAREEDGSWAAEPARLQDVNRTLKQIFTTIGCTMASVTTHSAKATLLHWAAVYGLSTETRARLGYHATAEGGSVKSYSRDILASPVAELSEMLGAIRRGEWKPDDQTHGPVEGESVDSIIADTAPFLQTDPVAIETHETFDREAAIEWYGKALVDSYGIVGDSEAVDDEGQVGFSVEQEPEGSATQMWSSGVTDREGSVHGGDDYKSSDPSECESTDNDASNADSDEEAERLILSRAEVALGLDRSIDLRRYMNMDRLTIHAGRPGEPLKTRCGLPVASLQLLACGEASAVDGKDERHECLKCFKR